MGFLDKLIHAVRRNSSTADVLLAVEALATRIGSAELADWADRELHGYPEEERVPAYRGPFTAEINVRLHRQPDRTRPLARTAFAAELRDSKLMRLYDVTVVEAVTHLERLAGEHLVRPWGAVHVDLLNQLIDIGGLSIVPGGTVVAAENQLAGSLVRATVNAVRDRALGLALTLERVAPDAGDRGGPSEPTPAMRDVIAKTVG
ncbi:AbiTii domain-containing protein [Kutzneria sp. CA-103260]|uniref:AbiTii domain-containing protein n=1 Tax=Kutzneria sp. CA-103260 TaxID=2802641 RepID=UPI001BAD8607|nr:hypothetical protein [Kutzneria sp. CA-103260]QUQ64037.1 AbiTii [Kutzneria sp. CA-103260]